jgi:lipoprotein-releasing system permease protein
VRNVVWIAIAALVLTLLATLYPALRASRVPPAEALRYE